MINSVFVDFDKTFGQGIFLGIEPKLVRADRADAKSPMVQANDGNGNLRWTCTVAVKVQRFEQSKKENIEVTLNSPKKPYEGIPIGSFVTLEGLEMGILKQDRGGFSTFFMAAAVRPLNPARQAASSQ